MGVSFRTSLLDDTVNDALGLELALAWSRVCPDNPVAALMERLPYGHRLVENGVLDLESATAASRESESLSSVLEGLDPSSDEWWTRREESVHARARSALLLDGTFATTRVDIDGDFLTSSGERLAITSPILRPPKGVHLWVVATAFPDDSFPEGVRLSLSYFSPYRGPVFLPEYGDGPPGDLIRSRVIERILPILETPAGISDALRDLLWDSHCPANARSASPLHDPAVREPLSDLIRDVILDEYRQHQRESARGLLPPPRLIKTHREAEEYAAEVLWALGFTDAEPTPPGADGGVDVVGPGVVAQVKMEGIPTGRPVLQAIAGIASVEGSRAVVFSLAGYTPQALEWAERATVACFEFAFDGAVEPRSSAATELLATVTSAP